MAALVSKTIDDPLLITEPVGKPGLGETVKNTLPSPSGGCTLGGRNPASGSVVGSPVAGLSEVNFQVTRPVTGSIFPLTRAIKFLSGRRSTSVVNSLADTSGVI